MLRNGILVLVCVVTMSATAWTAGPNPGERVPTLRAPLPKLAVNSEQARPQPPVSLDDLEQLAAKLKRNGDLSGAELLNRFVQEQILMAGEKVAPITAPGTDETAERILIEIEVFEVNSDAIPQELRLDKYSTPPTAKEIKDLHEELDRLVIAKQAIITLPRRTFDTRLKQVVRYEETSYIDIPTPNSDGTMTFEKRAIGIHGEMTAVLKRTGMLELHQICEVSRIDEANSIQILRTVVPGIKKYKIRSIDETIEGQPVLLTNFGGLFVFTTINPRPIEIRTESEER